jgi:predicted permease
MRGLRAWFLRMGGLFAGERRERELADELESHLQMDVDDRIRSGVPPVEARRLALIKLGGIEATKERYRDRRSIPILESVIQDVRYGLRQLRRAPAFTFVAVATLTLGIGANTAIFSVIEAVLLRPLPYDDPGRLVLLTDPQDPDDGGFLYKDLEALRIGSPALEDIAIYYRNGGWSRVTLTGEGEPEFAYGGYCSAVLFPLSGISPSLGRTFTPDEEGRRERVMVLSHAMWTSRFAGSREAIGKTLQLNGIDWEVIGVMPEDFHLPFGDDRFWAPLRSNPTWDDPELTTNVNPNHSRYFYARWQAMARLKPGASLEQAQKGISAAFAGIDQSNPDRNRGNGVSLVPLHVNVNGDTRLAMYVLFAAVSFVLLIACANVANLVLTRGAAREREMAVRTALGAGRARLLRQLLTESTLLALVSGAAGLVVAQVGVRALIAMAPGDIPRLEQAGVNPVVLTFTILSSLIAAVVFGFAPAVKISRTDPNESLKAGPGKMAGSISLTQTRRLLVILEFVLAVVLLTGAGLLIRSYLAIASLDNGLQPNRTLTMRIAPPAGASGVRINALYDRVLERVRPLPGVEAAGAIDGLFELGSLRSLGLRAIEGHDPEPSEGWTPLSWQSVRGDCFQAMGAPLVRGRYFSDHDGPNSPLVVIIDESMARRYWSGEDPIGQRIKGQDQRGPGDPWATIIGVVPDMRRNGLDRQPIPHVYEWYLQGNHGFTPDLVVRTSDRAGALAATLRAAVRAADETAILSQATSIEQQLSRQLSPRRFQTWLLSLFSAIALALASIGIYGVMHYSVVQRTQEIGIRVALGAEPRDLARLIVKEAAILALAGLGIGIGCALMVTRLMRGLLFGVSPTDAPTVAAVAILLALIAIAACYLPARRAMRVDPMVALRCE